MTSAPVQGTRPSDAERDRALAVLRDGAGSGRLSHDTFIRRMNVVLGARSRGELADVIRDLPRRDPRPTTWARELKSRLPRPGGERRTTRSGFVSPVDRLAAWLDALPRLVLAQRRADEPVAGLALPAPGAPTVRIGRGPGATLRLADLSVSRFHAELRHVDGSWMLRDLGSMNGTEVNALRITTPVHVRPGDRVRFGSVAYVLTWTA